MTSKSEFINYMIEQLNLMGNTIDKVPSKEQLSLDFFDVAKKPAPQANDNQSNNSQAPSIKTVACKI